MDAQPSFRRAVSSRLGALTALTALAALAAALVLSACSPYVYGHEVGAFSTGIDTTTSAYRTALDREAADRLAAQRQDWIAQRTQLGLTPDCQISLDSAATPAPARESPDAPPSVCQLVQPQHTPSQLSSTEREARRALPIAEALSSYAGALKAIATAEDRADLDAAAGELTSAISALSPEASRTRISATGGLLSALLGAGLDARRLSALRSGVDRARAPVAQLAPVLGEALDALRLQSASRHNDTIARLLNEMNRHGAPLSEQQYTQHLTQLQAETAAIEALRQAHPRQAAAGLVAAHEALALALHDNTRQSQAVITAIQQFAEQAGKLREAFD